MGILAKIFGGHKEQTIELLEASITQLRVGLFSTLSKFYYPIYGKQDGEFLSSALLNNVLLEKPGNIDGENFCRNNVELIEEELKKLSFEKVIAEALSYLYAAQTLYLVFITKDPFSKQAQKLGEKATKLSIYIPNTYDICGSDNVQECVFEIMKYSSKFIDESK